jgi:hypothetical protein
MWGAAAARFFLPLTRAVARAWAPLMGFWQMAWVRPCNNQLEREELGGGMRGKGGWWVLRSTQAGDRAAAAQHTPEQKRWRRPGPQRRPATQEGGAGCTECMDGGVAGLPCTAGQLDSQQPCPEGPPT